MNSIKCSECGFVAWAGVEFCKKCGAALGLLSTDGSYLPRQGHGNLAYNGELKQGLAICSLVLGILNLFTIGLLGVGAILGITLSLVALSKIKRSPSRYGGKGFATAGLVTSILSVVIIVPVGIIAAIAIPNLLASRRAANEGSAIQVLRRISAAEATYQSVHGRYGELDQLVAEELIDPDLAFGVRHGYRFKIGVATSEFSNSGAFEAVGVPVTYPSSGRRSFYIDESGVVREADSLGADATKFDSPLKDSGYSRRGPPSPAFPGDAPGAEY